MEISDVVEYMLEPVITRKEIFDTAIDRGLGEGMQIEKWILIEMLSRLKGLKAQGKLSQVEGEHKYKTKKTSRYEHCDLWWKDENGESWLEVKTIVFGLSAQKGKYSDISRDIKKGDRINKDDTFHHLTFLFPVDHDFNDKDLCEVYEGFILEKKWRYKIWPDKYLLIVLYKSGRGILNEFTKN